MTLSLDEPCAKHFCSYVCGALLKFVLDLDFEPTTSLDDEEFWEEVKLCVSKSSAGFGFTLQPVGPSYDALELYFDVKQSNLLNAESSQYYQTSVKIFQDVLQITELVPSGSADKAGLRPGLFRFKQSVLLSLLFSTLFHTWNENRSFNV